MPIRERYRRRLRNHPQPVSYDHELAECIAACIDCAQACTVSADASLNEADMARCIRLDLDCADVCDSLARVLSRQTHFESSSLSMLVKACLYACGPRPRECETLRYRFRHCADSADARARCQIACDELLGHLDS